jgi:hypothetical protein
LHDLLEAECGEHESDGGLRSVHAKSGETEAIGGDRRRLVAPFQDGYESAPFIRGRCSDG